MPKVGKVEAYACANGCGYLTTEQDALDCRMSAWVGKGRKTTLYTCSPECAGELATRFFTESMGGTPLDG